MAHTHANIVGRRCDVYKVPPAVNTAGPKQNPALGLTRIKLETDIFSEQMPRAQLNAELESLLT